ncbi:MAG: TldD/PmbA family protein [Eubacteriales bacterium]|uniref:TldD/PmbA family protein n=1 Tax=Baileyella intestinalis TaxID=2606709 RepID=UPI0022DF5A21|nr:TldD/PmbA family protein [Baileyella intestinalis]MCI7685755.1 TldD/PmbA family protein [Clostridiales bacterium]MDD5874885.1 TldD/PmbA family protein [Baileyella intestinalis]MDY2994326.1 TldD/PmbA family protein [Baileyella intestinalis]
MKAKFSEYLDSIAEPMKNLVQILSRKYDYVSLLSTDSPGLTLLCTRTGKKVSHHTMTTERGNVIRVAKDGLYSEFSFNEFDPDNIPALAERITAELDSQIELLKITGTSVYETGVLSDEKKELFVEKETEILPEKADTGELMEILQQISQKGLETSGEIVESMVRAQSTHISKMFITPNRFLRQSYVYSEAMAAVVAARDGMNRMAYEVVSGCRGPEMFKDLLEKVSDAAATAVAMLDAEPAPAGTYDIITAPDVTGLIAHEAFGHGVEMDMFVKHRAIAADHMGQRVGSDKVTMHEGALCDESVTAFAFDDEGTLAGDVTEIDKGILKAGICDALAAKRLGTEPTGNGKRQNFAHKAYTRMTNTVFDSGRDSLEDMIKSIDCGYLLKGMDSGMEDPKHWGIQCIVSRGYEIRNGKLTGKMIAPVVLTGFVPDLLKSVTMASPDRIIEGNGGCGKGHKEWVKVADGGPYLKARARLG